MSYESLVNDANLVLETFKDYEEAVDKAACRLAKAVLEMCAAKSAEVPREFAVHGETSIRSMET